MESLHRVTKLDRNEGETEDLFDVAFWFVVIFQENRSLINEVDKLTGKWRLDFMSVLSEGEMKKNEGGQV